MEDIKVKKIISLFERDYDGNHQVFDRIVSGAEWVINGKGIATEKIDGTACMIRDGKLYKRYDVKEGKIPPLNFESCEDKPDEHTGHWPGWIPVTNKPEDKWHQEAFDSMIDKQDGTYELIGNKVQGNPYGLKSHKLVKHGANILCWVPISFDGIRDYLESHIIEGIVWHHSNGRMVKIKACDFGIKWPRTFSKL